MKTATVTVETLWGLHMATAAPFVRIAELFSSELVLKAELDGRTADAKSIMQTCLGHFTPGTKLKVLANGPDEEIAIEVLSAFLQKRVDAKVFSLDEQFERMIEQKAIHEILQYLKQYPESEGYEE